MGGATNTPSHPLDNLTWVNYKIMPQSTEIESLLSRPPGCNCGHYGHYNMSGHSTIYGRTLQFALPHLVFDLGHRILCPPIHRLWIGSIRVRLINLGVIPSLAGLRQIAAKLPVPLQISLCKDGNQSKFAN